MARDLFEEAGISVAGTGRDLFAEAGIDFKPQAETKRTASGTFGDALVTGLKGAIGLPEAVVGVADIPTGGRLGKALEGVGYRPSEAKNILDSYYSDAQQEANRKVRQADGFVDTLSAAIDNPSTIATAVGESLPLMLGGAGVARGILKVAPKIGGVAAGATGEGVIAGGYAAESIRGETKDGLLTPTQSAVAVASGVGTGILGFAGGKLAQRLGVGDIDTILASGAGQASAKGFARQVAGAGISEGVFEELPQSIQEKMWENFALEKPIDEGVGNAAAMGLLAGAAMGGAGGGYNAFMGGKRQDEAPGNVSPEATPAADILGTPEQPAPNDNDPVRDPFERLAEIELISEQRALTQNEVTEADQLWAKIDSGEAMAELNAGEQSNVTQVDAQGNVSIRASDPAKQPGAGYAIPNQESNDAGTVAPVGTAGVADGAVTQHTITAPDIKTAVQSAAQQYGPDAIITAHENTPDGVSLTVAVPMANSAGDLQNRDRSRAASVNQMQSIARNPDYMRLGPSRTPDSGAPMVFATGNNLSAIQPTHLGREDVAVMADGQRVPFRYAVVDAYTVNPSNFADGSANPAFSSSETGVLKALNNGRTAGMRAAHGAGNGQAYTAELIADADAHGVPVEAIRSTPNPMLVRVYSEDSNTRDMAAKSQGQGLGMSPAELAAQDAPLIDLSALAVYEPGDVSSAGNRDFVRSFVGGLQASGQDIAPLITSDGQLSQMGRQRIQAALMQAAFGDANLVQEMFDSVDTDIKAIGEALKSVAGSWAGMREAAKIGAINPDTDITGNLIQVVRMIQRARRDKTSIYDMINQRDLMTGEAQDELTVSILRLFYTGHYLTRAVGKERLIDSLSRYLTGAMQTQEGGGLFGDTVTAQDILNAITQDGQYDAGNQAENSSSESGRGGTARGGADRPGAQAPRPGANEAGRGADENSGEAPAQAEPATGAQEGGEGVGAEGLALTGQTPAEVRQQERDRVAAEAEATRLAAQEAADKKAAEKQSLEDAIKARAANPDNFQFGEDSKAAAKPMGSLFDQAPAPATPKADQPRAETVTAPAQAEASNQESIKKSPTVDAVSQPKSQPSEMDALKAEMGQAIGELASILGAKQNLTPEEESQIIPVMSKIFRIAAKMGYVKFKDAANYVLGQIRTLAGTIVADKISIENLQAGYLNIITSIEGASSKIEVVSYDSIEDLEKANVTDERSSTDLERNRRDANAQDSVGEDGVRAGRDGDGRTGRQGVEGAEGNGGERGGVSRREDEAAATGERGDQQIYTGAPELTPGAAGNNVDLGSGDGGIDGLPVEPSAAGQIENLARSDYQKEHDRLAQKRADKLPQAEGLEAIKAALPILSEGQQEDVLITETRFAAPDGYGMLFTNGTGTGKTFSGLGVIKRFANQGKQNILIVAPNDEIITAWIKAGRMLGLDLSRLADTNDAGKGIVITTYANMGANNSLASRDWDLVVHDEAHYLAMDKDGTNTNALKNLRAISLHPDGVYQRHSMIHAADIEKRKKLDADAKLMRMSDDQRNWVAADKAQAEADKIAKKLTEQLDAIKEDVASRQLEKRTRVMFLSATPFAYEKTVDWANGYIFDYNEGRASEEGDFRGYNVGRNRDQFMMQHFGYRMRYGKLTQPDAKVDSGLMQRQFNTWLKKKGSVAGRMLDVAADYDRRFILVDSAIGQRIDEALQWFGVAREGTTNSTRKAALHDVEQFIYEKFDYLSRRYLLESIKAREVVPHIREHLAMGRKVVVFHDYKKGGGFNPFQQQERIPGQDATTSGDTAMINQIIGEFRAEFKDLINSDLFRQSSPIEMFQQEFPDVMLFNGDVPQKTRRANVQKFQDDASGPQVILVQSAAGKEGISLHDTTGKHQRVLFNLGQPTQPTTAIQQEGRIYRTGQVTDAIFRYLNTGTNWEKWAFATTIATRASAAENLGMGELARSLKDAFITGFEESGDYRAGMENEGKGGKERDKAANNALTEYDRARSFYFGTQKKTSKTKAQEGADYFATPEPVGLKMVEWADIRPGEKVLEPSAGHGAIARWVPTTAERTAIEPSMALRPRLAMVFDGQIIDSDFESMNVVNKFDAIVMNPPFGSGGKTAVDHLAKAATHLRDGGRIVALLPTGPAADKKFDKWFYEESSKPIKPLGKVMIDGVDTPIYKGDTIESRASWAPTGVVTGWRDGAPMVAAGGSFAGAGASMVSKESIKSVQPTGKRTEAYQPAAGLQLVADIKMPAVTFERAGTQVMTRIVVIEKTSSFLRKKTYQDFTNAEDINDLFDRLENMALPNRAKEQEQEAEEAPKPGRKAKPVTDTVAAQAAAEKAGLEIIEHTTAKGKIIRGVVRTDLSREQAKEIDEFTFKKDGGWFIREKHLVGDGTKLSRGQSAAEPITEQQATAAITSILGKAGQLLMDAGQIVLVRTEAGLKNLPGAVAWSKSENALQSENGLPNESPINRAIDATELAELRRTASRIETPERGITFRIDDSGKAIVTGPARAKVPGRFQRFAKDNGLTLVVQRAPGVAGAARSAAMPVEYRESGALYFAEMPTHHHYDRTGKTRFAKDDGATQGATLPDGRIVLVLENLTEDNIAGVLKHEGFHASIKQLIGEEAYQQIMGKLGAMRKAGNGAAWFKQALAAVPKDTKESDVNEEIGAYAVEQHENGEPQPLVIRNWVKSLLSALRTAIIRRMPAGKLKNWAIANITGQDMARLAVAGLRAKASRIDLHSVTTKENLLNQRVSSADTEVSGRSGSTSAGGISIVVQDLLKSNGVSKVVDPQTGEPINGDFDGANPDIRYSLASTAAKAKVDELTSPDAINTLIYNFQNKFVDLKNIKDRIVKMGGQITDLNDAYLGEETYHSKVMKRGKDFLEGEMKQLLQQLHNNTIKKEDFEQFLHARHAPERNAEMAKRNPNQAIIDAGRAQADADVKALEVQLQSAIAKNLATKAIDAALTKARAEKAKWHGAQSFQGTEDERNSLSGMSDAEAAQIMAAIPAGRRSTMDSAAAKVDAINAKTLDIQLASGLIDKATFDAIKKTYQYYVPLHRDEAHPDQSSHSIGQGFSVKGAGIQRATGSNAKVTNILSHIAMQREAQNTRAEKNSVVKRLYLMAAQNPLKDFWTIDKPPMIKTIDERTGFVRSGVDPMYKSKPNVVMARIAGKDVAIVFNEQNPEAVRLAEALKNLDGQELDVVERSIGRVTRWIASVNTQYNPIFGLINFARDVQGAMFNLTTTELKDHKAATWKETFRLFKEITKSGFQLDKMNAADQALWNDFQNNGGATGYRDMFANPEERTKALEKELKVLDGGPVAKKFSATAQWLSDYNESMENVVRLAAYKISLQNGMSKERAASLAKNLTVNFNRKGAKAQKLGAFYAFFNASIQGSTRLAQTLKGPAGRKIIAGGIALGVMQQMLGVMMMGGGDDDEWEKIPDFVKERSIVIPTSKDTYISIPMPLGFNVIPNIGRLFAEWAMGGSDKPTGAQLAKLVGVVVSGFNPVGGTDLVDAVTPTAADPMIALLRNKDWTGKPIYREDMASLDPTPGFTRTKDSATPWAKGMAYAVNWASGGTDYQPGRFSWTPDQIDYLIGAATGGVGREVGKLAQTLAAPFSSEELPMHKVPLFGRVIGSTAGVSGQSGKFYENIRTLNGLEREIKGRNEAGEDAGALLKDDPRAELVGLANASEKQVKALRKNQKLLKSEGDNAGAKEIDGMIAEVMKGLNAEMRQAAR